MGGTAALLNRVGKRREKRLRGFRKKAKENAAIYFFFSVPPFKGEKAAGAGKKKALSFVTSRSFSPAKWALIRKGPFRSS